MHLAPSECQMDVVWVIVDKLRKSAYYITIRATYLVSTLARLYKDQIVRVHRVQQEIVLEGPNIRLFLLAIFPERT